MENTKIQILNFENQKVRTIFKDGQTWWVLKDVCTILNLSDPNKVSSRLDDDEKGTNQIRTLGGVQNLIIVNENGLYNVIFRSDKPIAKKFRRWVTHDILPSIRAHGYYATPEAQEQLSFSFKNSTKLLFADAVAASSDSISIGTLARILRGRGVNIGRIRLFRKLRELGYLVKAPEAERNTPTQKALKMRLLQVCEVAHIHANGTIKYTHVTMVTGAGQMYFTALFTGGRLLPEKTDTNGWIQQNLYEDEDEDNNA